MKKCILCLALVATTCLSAQDFHSGGLYFNYTSDSAPYTAEVVRCESNLTDVIIPASITRNVAARNITVRAKLPDVWTDVITAWVWPTGGEGQEVIPTKEGEWYVYTHHCTELNIIFKNGYGWTVNQNQTVDIAGITSNVCIQVTAVPGAKASYEYVDCEWSNSSEEESTEVIEYTITGIGGDGFFASSSTITSVTMPNTITYIGNWAFSGCNSLSTIAIPENVTKIGIACFAHCSSLSSISIPQNVMEIGENTFNGCTFLIDNFVNLSSLDAKANNYWGATIADNEIDGLLLRNDTVVDCRPHVKHAVIPNYITYIGESAFANCFNLFDVTIPEGVTGFGDYAFNSCSINSITIPNSVTQIGYAALYGCYYVTSIYVPATVTYIGEAAFAGMSSLMSLQVEAGNPKYDSRDNCNAIIETATNTLLIGCRTTSIPLSVTSIANGAFSNCRYLSSITIPNSVASIGNSAFQYCIGLSSATIGSGVKNIGAWAFEGCIQLYNVVCKAKELPEMGDQVFTDVPTNEATLYVPASSVETYKNAEQWKNFYSILPIEEETGLEQLFSTNNSNVQKRYHNGELYIFRDGKTYTITGQEL